MPAARQPAIAVATASPASTDPADITTGSVIHARVWRAATLGWFAIVALLVYLNLQRHLPLGIPAGIVMRGVVIGLLTGMTSVGLVLVHRANRIVNFAQASLGVVASVLAYNLMVVVGMPWLVAIVFSIAVATALSAGMEFAVVRRLSRAPRLIATVATIGLTQVLAFLAITIAGIFDRYNYEAIEAAGMRFPTPFGGTALTLSGITFAWDHVLVLALVPLTLGALAWFSARSIVGVAIRAAAQNGDRAGLLGIRVPRLSTLTWALAGALSGMAAVLQAPILGFSSFGAAAVGASLGLFVRALAAAVIGRLESMPVAFGAAVLLGVAEQVVFYNYSRSSFVELGLLLAVLVALLAQRRRISRASWVENSTWDAIRQARPIAPAIAQLPSVRVARRVGIVVVVGVPLLFPLLFGLDTVRLLSVICIYALVALSLVLLSGWAGQVSLGQWAFSGIGAFAAARMALAWEADLVVVTVFAGLAGAVVALLVGLPALRIRGLFLGATTVVLATTCEQWLFTLDEVRPYGRLTRPTVFGVYTPQTEDAYFYVCFGALVLAVLALSLIRRSTVGRALLAIRDNETAAQAHAIDPIIVKLGAFAVSGFLAASAGSLYAYLQQSVEVTQYRAFTSLFLFSMVVIGGVGSIAGGILGAAYVLGAQYFLPEAGGYLATGVGVLLLLLVLPGGLSQLLYAGRDRLLARLVPR